MHLVMLDNVLPINFDTLSERFICFNYAFTENPKSEVQLGSLYANTCYSKLLIHQKTHSANN